jgi:prevent-host-death family protein
MVKAVDHYPMSSSVSIGKAKPRLCELVEQAQAGQTHIITVHEKPAAQIGPVTSRSEELTKAWRERRKNIFLNRKGQKRIEISDLIREGRK